MEPTRPPAPAAEPARPKTAPPPPRPDEPKRRRPTAAERRFAGFGDGVERAWCAARGHRLPEGFPVQRRHGVATLAVRPVARRDGALLLCDGAHSGPHRWPDGDEPTDAERAAAG